MIGKVKTAWGDDVPDDECKHGLLVGTCTLCKGKPAPLEASHTIDARFPGTCPHCGERISEGDCIGRVAALDAWVCEACFDG